MGWQAPIVPGDLGHWTCDSCTTMRDKSCAALSGIRLSWMRGKFQADKLRDVYPFVEAACPYSQSNKQRKSYVVPSESAESPRKPPDRSGRIGH